VVDHHKINWITKWICWNPSSSHSIVVGIDRIIGLDNASFLSAPLITLLNSHNNFFLYQTRLSRDHNIQDAGWKAGIDYDLSPELNLKWENYCSELSRAGITLTKSMDQLLWDGGNNSGHIYVHNLYSAIANSTWLHNIYRWRKQFWSWNIPLKIKLST
jgi:hypothetical protein